jgi:N-acetylglucosaminyl-diphospho-decaprenol L-rhamnosyltransferase
MSHARVCSSRTGAVVVAHDQVSNANRCVTALASELDAENIVVVVNRPDLIPTGELADLEGRVGSLVLNDRELGYGANLNHGVRGLSPNVALYLLVNDDVIPHPGSISTLADCMDAKPEAGMVAPRLIGSEGESQHVGRRFPSLTTEMREVFLPPGQRWISRSDPLFLTDTVRSGRVDWAVGAALLVRAEAFAQVGGFDESFFLYWEEVDFALRLQRNGWPTFVCPEAVMEHIGGASTASHVYAGMLHASRSQFIKKHWSPSHRALLVAAQGVIYLWNTLYVVGRIALQPWRRREKMQMWSQPWSKRLWAGDKSSSSRP